VSTEEIRAASSEGSLSLRVSTEEIRAASSEGSLSLRVSTEEIRAASAELSIDTRLHNAFTGVAGFIDALTVAGDVTGTSFTTTSDARLKKDVEEVMNAMEIVSRIHPVYYNWIDGRATLNPGHKEIGFLAQELEAVLPNVVKTYDDGLAMEGGRKAVSYDRVVSLLVAAVKELKAEVDALKVKVAALKA
jgi:ribosomal protein L31